MNSHCRYLLFLLLSWLLYVPAHGNLPGNVGSRKLEAIGKTLKSQYGVSTMEDLSALTICGRKLAYSYNNEQVLTRLGIYLFPAEIREAVGTEMADFLERAMLESVLEENNGKLKPKLKEYNMELEYNQVPYGSPLFRSLAAGLNTVRDQSRFSLTHDTLAYCANWLNEDNSSFTVRFPANYELILGKDKKELDDQLGVSLSHCSCTGRKPVKPAPELNDLEKGKGFLTLKGKFLFIRDMNSNTYFSESPAGAIQWLYDEHYPAETLANLFHHDDPRAEDIRVRILHRKYGKETAEYLVPLSRLICFFEEGFDTYIGFEQTGQPDLTAVVFFYNTKTNYLNMLRVKTNTDALFNKGTLEAELHSYIPEHNIKKLFGEYRDSGKLFPAKL